MKGKTIGIDATLEANAALRSIVRRDTGESYEESLTLDGRARSQPSSWTEVAHAFGYHDQMHLIHDFERLSGETPTNVLTEVENAHRELIDAVRMGRMPAMRGDAHRLML